ncbi:hypothetical protein A8139_10915 [Marinomonas primoryensis]|uniref:Uncharacterized protein n=1 Tax=Marinomonas primoryensis TaxID=178399 RepID=A0A2Z4PTS3_9GAMM|nr:hypothetical protein [Marinomonas primoryensis]AWY00454.1 hypothetical protein A8139_10915 [Marinomonas primoryensis]
MASHKRLKSVVQSIAHRSVSALSFVHPHLGKACEEAGINSIEVDLSETEPCPRIFVNIEPLRLALNALRETFYGLVVSEGFEPKDIVSVNLVFEFKHGQLDHYCSDFTATLVSASKTYQSRVNYLGNTEQV